MKKTIINLSKSGHRFQVKDLLIAPDVKKMVVKDIDRSNPDYDVLTLKPYYRSIFHRVFEYLMRFFRRQFWLIIMIILSWISISTIFQAIKCPKMIPTELFLHIPKHFVLNFNNCN